LAPFRHALAILALPTMVTVFVPLWISLAYSVHWVFPDSFFGSLAIAAGLASLAGGLALFVACVLHFAEEEGTLAPWDPPRGLVVKGAYRYVRNPMISGVIFVLLGEALVLRSLPHLLWMLAFTGLNLVYIPLSEEPGLERRFGDAYLRYRENVPRFVPRMTPWKG
jgi:protein-S-isoprenylcysteine O-methyltransferase Ste14